MTLFMIAWTLYALFAEDIRRLATDKPADNIFYVFTIIAMCIFSLEINILCVFQSDYIFSYYFWLDIITTATMIMDIGWVFDTAISAGYSDPSDTTNISEIAR